MIILKTKYRWILYSLNLYKVGINLTKFNKASNFLMRIDYFNQKEI